MLLKLLILWKKIALESLILEMARDALAIPLSQQRAAVTLCDEKRREEPSNLLTTIPVVPPSGNFRAYGDLLIVRNTFLPPHQFPLIGDGPRTNAYNTRYAASSRPAGITAALNFLRHMAAEGATYQFIDVHFSGLSSRDLCSAANQKKAEYLAAWNNQVLTIRRLPTHSPIDALNLDDSAGSSTSGFDLDITEIAPSTTMVPHTTDHNRIDANKNPINHVAHSKNISAIQNGSNTQASIVKSPVDDVSSTVDSITDGSNLKKRNLPTDDTSGSDSIASRVKVLRRTTNENQNKSRPPDTALASLGSKQYK